MSYLGQFKALGNPDFYGRVWMAMYKTADDIINEDPATANHPLRFQLAQAIQVDPEPYAGTFVKKCAFNPSVANSINDAGFSDCADADLNWVVGSVWDLATSQFVNNGTGNGNGRAR